MLLKLLFTLLYAVLLLSGFSQTPKTIYCFPGQGSDRRIFDSIKIDPRYTLKIIEYGTPEKGMDMQDFAKELAQQIDTTEAYYC